MLDCKYARVQPSKTDKMFGELTGSLHRLSQHQEAIIAKIGMLEARLGLSGHMRILSQPHYQYESLSYGGIWPVKPAQLSLQHTTPPHELIRLWPSLPPLLQEARANVDNAYVLKAECRESSWTPDHGEYVESYDGPGSDSIDLNHHGHQVTSVREILIDPRQSSHPPISASVIRSLCKRYVRHIHILHPFIDKHELRTLRDRFISWQSTRLSECDYPLNRRRVNAYTSYQDLGTKSGPDRTMLADCRFEHALVYLVLALGAICAYEGPLPKTWFDHAINETASLAAARSETACCQGNRQLAATGFEQTVTVSASPMTVGSGSRIPELRTGATSSNTGRPSVHVLGHEHVGSLDFALGVDYYAKAKHIIDEHSDGDTLLLAQIHLLMGLYNGQLAFVEESMRWYARAGRSLQVLLNQYNLCDESIGSRDDGGEWYRRSQGRIKNKRHNLVVLASWSCLQLESDILADLHLPSSGIQTIQDLLPLPLDLSEEYCMEAASSARTTDVYEDGGDIVIHFTAQSFLRKRLNLVHGQLYGFDCLDQSPTEVQATLDGHQMILDGWRERLPKNLQWNDWDPPSSHVLSARLQAKYWGAQYVVTRPFLDYALHILPHIRDGRSVEEAALDASGNARSMAEINIFKAIHRMGEEQIWRACQRCLEAASHSTTAFDGISGRLIVTNIHGTAHAFVSLARWNDGTN